jgi:large subunit ribosomal protein L2
VRIVAAPDAEFKDGNALPLYRIPVGLMIHNVEMKPGKGGQIARSAGTFAQLVAGDEKYARSSCRRARFA